MANDNDFVDKSLGSLREPAEFQPNATHARTRLRAHAAPRSRKWRWSAVPVTAVLLLALIAQSPRAVAGIGERSSAVMSHLHYGLMAHWYGLLRMIQGPSRAEGPVVASAAVEPTRLSASVPRSAPEFKILEPSGKETLLSAQKGKVVVIQFLFTWCGHCDATAQWLSTMQAELGSKGLQVFGVAFNDEVNTLDLSKNKAETARFGSHAAFPVGLSPKVPVLEFLGIPTGDSYGVPQLVVIDRRGVIQAQTSARPGQGELIEEPVMLALVNRLLTEK